MKIFKNRFGELRGGWAVAFALLAMYIAQIAGGIVIGIVAGIQAALSGAVTTDANSITDKINKLITSPDLQLAAQAILVPLSIGATLLLFHLLYKRPFSQAGLTGFKKPHVWKDFFVGCALGIVSISVAVAVLLLTGSAEISGVTLGQLAKPQMWVWFFVFVAVGINEELLTRGFMMTALKTTRSKPVILLVPAAVFALMHLLNPSFSWLSALNIFLVGLVFAGLFIRSGQLWLPIGFHFTWNFFQGNFYGIEVSGLKTPSVLETAFSGPDWLTGGAFGAEGGVAVTGVMLLLIAAIWFFWPQREQPVWSFESDLPLTRQVKRLQAENPEE